MMKMRILLLLSLIWIIIVTSAEDDAQCRASDSAKFRFRVSSRLNATGHRLAEVHIIQNVNYVSSVRAHDHLTVDVEQDSAWCDGRQELKTTALAAAPPLRFRHPDYELFTGVGYYKRHVKADTWDRANENCNKEGAHLLIVNSDAELGVMKQLLARNPKIEGATWNDWFFVGFDDRAVEGQYVTVLGEPLNSTGPVKWHPGEPNNTPWNSDPDQDCGGMYKGGTIGDLPCSGKTAYICEQEI